MTHYAKMRRFSKIMVVCFIAYLDRADSAGNNDTSIILVVTLFPEIHLLECRKCKMYQFEKTCFKVSIPLFVKISLLANTFCPRWTSLNT